jgi:hypothetical protein
MDVGQPACKDFAINDIQENESLPYLILALVAAISPPPYLASLPFSGFVLALPMVYGLARGLILSC